MPTAMLHPRVTNAPTLTVREAAYVAGAPEQRIQRAIDRGKLSARVRRHGGHTMREIPMRSLLDFAIEQRVSSYLSLRSEAWKAVHTALDAVVFEAVMTVSEAPATSARRTSHVATSSIPPVIVGPLTLSLGTIVGEIVDGIRAVLESRAEVETDPEIRGGEPVVKGTRVPVYRLADLKSQGVSDAVLLDDYPSLSQERLAAALLYATLHPRRGRPGRAAPWHALTLKVLLPATEGPRPAHAASHAAAN